MINKSSNAKENGRQFVNYLKASRPIEMHMGRTNSKAAIIGSFRDTGKEVIGRDE